MTPQDADTDAQRSSLKSLPRAALDAHQILLFRLRKDLETETGYRLEYRLSFAEPYYAISHSWTDRTGNGDSIIIVDLAPWPICLSPAKLALLDWLYYVQESKQGDLDAYWTSWYWLDLFCIDQTREDEELFSRQLQQIPQVFHDAVGCLAILASWPCEKARSIPKNVSYTDSLDIESTEDYDAVAEWMDVHARDCSCLPFVDAWFTRVWTRQELLYSRKVLLVTANIWLSHYDPTSVVWTRDPQHYIPPSIKDGLRELSSCLFVWATRMRLPIKYYGPAMIASMARALIKGEIIELTVATVDGYSPLQDVALSEWFAFNWSMLLNGSIRYTSHRRDAIISQMLLLPGYQVPDKVWSMTLEAIAANANSQFRRLLKVYQLVATTMTLESGQGQSVIGNPIISTSFDHGGLTDVLHAVGTPTVLPIQFQGKDMDQELTSGLMAYVLDGRPRYTVIEELDIDGRTQEVAHHLLSLQTLWAMAADCRTSWNVRDCLTEIQTLLSDSKLDSSFEKLLDLKRALKHCLGRITNSVPFRVMTIHKRTASNFSRAYDPDEVDDLHFPGALIVMITYQGNLTAPHTNVIFGNPNLAQEGEIWGLGADLGTKLEHGIAVKLEEDGRAKPVACGALMPTEQERSYRRIVKGFEPPNKSLRCLG